MAQMVDQYFNPTADAITLQAIFVAFESALSIAIGDACEFQELDGSQRVADLQARMVRDIKNLALIGVPQHLETGALLEALRVVETIVAKSVANHRNRS